MKKILLFFAFLLGGITASYAQIGTMVTANFWPTNASYQESKVSDGSFLGTTWTAYGFNNNNNSTAWNNIRCGRKNYASTAYIVSDNAIESAIEKFELEIPVTNAKLSTAKLYVCADNTFGDTNTTVVTYPTPTVAGTWSLEIPADAQGGNKYYKFEFDCLSGSANGFVQLNSITAYAPEGKVKNVSFQTELDGAEQKVTLSCATDGASIYYGFAADEITTQYTAPFNVSENCTVYAYAEKGEDKGAVTSQAIVVPYTSFKDVMDKAEQNEQLTIVGNFTVIHKYGNYTILTDGTTNTIIYSLESPVEIGTNISKIEAKVSYYNKLFRLDNAELTQGGDGAAAPTLTVTSINDLDLEANLFQKLYFDGGCTISDTQTKPILTYMGESLPISTVLIDNAKVKNGTGYTITALVWKAGDEYQISPIEITGGEELATVATPVISPAKRELKEDDRITITCTTPDAVIYYTINGDDPTQESTKYTEGFLPEGDFTVKAIAFYENDDKVMLPSGIASRDYHVYNPYLNVLSTETHESGAGASTYNKHTDRIDDVNYAMYSIHNSDNLVQMNNSGNNFSYLVQTSDNEGLALDYIEFEVDHNNKNTIVIKGSNTPYEVWPDDAYDKDKESASIQGNGVIIKEVDLAKTTTTDDNIVEKIDFPKDYNYFALYIKSSGAVYFKNITIAYRDPKELNMEEAPKIEGNIALTSDEDGLLTDELPYHEDWILHSQLNEEDAIAHTDHSEGDGIFIEKALDPATLHILKVWYKHYYHNAETEAVELKHLTTPSISVTNAAEENQPSYIDFGTIGEGVTVYFTLDGSDPEIPTASEAPATVKAALRGEAKDGEYVISDIDEYSNTTHAVTSATPKVRLEPLYFADSASTPQITLNTQAAHESGIVSDTKTSSETINIPTGVNEIGVDAAGNATYFNLEGIKVEKPENGTYIRVANGKADKVIVK